MKIMKLVGGLAILGAFGYGVWYLKDKGVRLPSERPESVKVAAGTPIKLLLLDSLSSGGSDVGQRVRLVVAEDVKVGPDVAIPRGAIALGKVTRSRGGSMLGAVSNQPARLEIDLGTIRHAGQSVPLTLGKTATYAFTQANTKPKTTPNVAAAWQDADARDGLRQLAEAATSDNPADKVLALRDAKVRQLVDRLELKNLGDLIDRSQGKDLNAKNLGGDAETLSRTLSALADGDIGRLAGVDAALLARALGELSSLAHGLTGQINGLFKGSNIRALPGTEILAKTQTAVTIRL